MDRVAKLTVEVDKFNNCPYCGMETFEAEIKTAKGGIEYVIVCQTCEVAWQEVKED